MAARRDAALLAVLPALALTAAAVGATLGEGGRFIMATERFWDCAVGEHGYDGSMRHHLRYERFNPFTPKKTLALYGNVTYSLPFNDSYWENKTAAIWAQNQWKSNAFAIHTRSKACSVYRALHPEQYRHLTGDDPTDTSKECLVPAGTYTFDGIRIPRTSHKNLPNMPYGRYRVLFTGGILGRPGLTLCAYGINQLLPDLWSTTTTAKPSQTKQNNKPELLSDASNATTTNANANATTSTAKPAQKKQNNKPELWPAATNATTTTKPAQQERVKPGLCPTTTTNSVMTTDTTMTTKPTQQQRSKPDQSPSAANSTIITTTAPAQSKRSMPGG